MKKLKPDLIKLSPLSRLYSSPRPIIGLTGGIATGKSTAARILISRGYQVIDADRLVKDIYKKKDTLNFIKGNYPSVWIQDSIDFPALHDLFFSDSLVKEQIENYIYQQLPVAFAESLDKISADHNFIIYDVPLLFEKRLETKVDLTVVVYAPASLQRARLLGRDGHLDEMATKILSHQLDIEAKKQNSDFVINNSSSLLELAAEVDQFLLQILK